MKILVLGSGLIGPAAAFNAMSDPEVTTVTLCDLSQSALDQASETLARLPGSDKLKTVAANLNNAATMVPLMAEHEAIVAALPSSASGQAARLATQAGTPLVDLTRPAPEEIAALQTEVAQAGNLIVLSCGLEPGLTEIMAHHLALKLDRVDELHIKCGGIPKHPQPPLDYKIVFGGRHLPLRETDARIVENGALKPVPRYSGVEAVEFPGVGLCEAWHEGFMPWLLELPVLQNLKLGTQKTVRWPGYAEKVTALKALGMLSLTPIEVDGVQVKPKHVLDAVNYPHVKLAPHEPDVTTFRVEVIGLKKGRLRRYSSEMVDHYDEATGITSMARTTAYTGAIVARMIARGEVSGSGVLPPEQLITGRHFKRLLQELAAVNIHFELTTEKVKLMA